ncbi:MAG TPA: DinB family protein [Thermoanaerobaculia bacterium]|nr:DinB family protein [Thermoanaerobaculia bacterium]
MSESFDEYKRRLHGYLGDRDPLEVQSETVEQLRRLIHGRSDETLTRSPAPGKWSVAQILGHLADGEIVLGYRMRSMLAESGCPIAAYDQARWAESMRYSEIPAATSLERFAQLRAWNLALLSNLSDEEWDRFGVHAERGRESVRDTARLYAGHDLNHTMQIRGILEGS